MVLKYPTITNIIWPILFAVGVGDRRCGSAWKKVGMAQWMVRPMWI